MNLIIEQLKEDHRQLVRVLYHLDREIKALSGLGPASSSSEKILDILDYIQVYPEIWHHPTEDLIYELLLEKDIPEPSRLANCIEEHGILELLTENLHSYLDQLAGGNTGVGLRLIKAGSDYVKRQLDHMEHEQNTLFPLMEQYLDQGDWDTIKQRLKSQQRSMDGSSLQRYQSLYRGIAESSAITAH